MTDSFPAPVIKLLSKPELFDSTWYVGTYPDVLLSGMSPHAHYTRFGILLGRAPNLDLQKCLETRPFDAVVKHAKMLVGRALASISDVPQEFDEDFYLHNNPSIDHRNLAPYDHFVQFGHKDLRNPSADFDIVWYLQNYGNLFDVNDVDPFSHYIQEGRDRGFTPRPPRHVKFDATVSCSLPASAKRACLFAAYDADSQIDEYVLVYLRDLAKHADVFYMADSDMPGSELAKLEGIVKGSWARRHGAYDFGSYSILARDLVGWDKLAEYDEVIFANDSCYLVQPLEKVFSDMAQKSCAWWGLQATKGIYSTRAYQPFPTIDGVVSVDEIKADLLDQFECDSIYDFHIGSYFVAFRKNVVKDERFQRVINGIQSEKRKLSIVLKYEVGLTHFLIGHGYEFDTWVQTVTIMHPVYTDVAFDLLKDGFPLFKRYMLAENPYKISSIAYWKAAISDANSLTSLTQIEDNYLRVSNADKLYRNFNIMVNSVLPDPPMGHAEFQQYDQTTPKYDHYWGFPVCVYSHTFSDNCRAVFESIKDDPSITKVIFTRDRTIMPGGVNVICVPLKSREGQVYLARCRNLFVRHGPRANLEWPISAERHNIINLWHGIPLKRIGIASLDQQEKIGSRKSDNNELRAIISASEVDRLAMTAAYAPKIYKDIWMTGLPRHDFITKPEEALPEFLKSQLADVRQLTNGRQLILFCPTFRNDQKKGYYNFKPNQVAALAKWLRKNNMVMGIREHLADKALQYSSQLSGDTFVRVPSGRFPDIEILYREAQILVTDYSSCFIDYMLTGRPMISFAYDLEDYKERERGLFYELEDVFPGPIAQDFPALMKSLGSSVKKPNVAPSAAYQMQRKFFIKYTDSGNAERVIGRTKAICEGSDLFKDFEDAAISKISKSIAFVYAVSGDATNRHRIFSLISQLHALGWTCHAMDFNRVSVEVLARAEFVSFCNIEMSPRAMDLAEGARGTGGKVIYDTDDLTYDEDSFVKSNSFVQNIDFANKLLKSSHNRRNLMMLADGFTVATPPLLQSVEKFGRPAAIVDNALSVRMLEKYADAPERETGDKTNLVYIAKSPDCLADFHECRDALLDLLSNRADVVLHVVGAADLDDLLPHIREGQMQRYGAMSDEAMHVFLHKMDINLAPLSDTPFNDAKSAFGIVEAALHAVPTIASPSETYRQVIQDKETGYLARTQKEWTDALYEAVDDVGQRHQIAQAASRIIVPAFSAQVVAKQLSQFLIGMKINDL
ncbi:MAG: CDP-glycerol glycerophosphotransferase [Candidatus Azotimanducaceae bacterium]